MTLNKKENELDPNTQLEKPDRFPTHNYTPRSQQVFDISRAQGEPVVRPDSIRNDFTWITEALQARHISWKYPSGLTGVDLIC